MKHPNIYPWWPLVLTFAISGGLFVPRSVSAQHDVYTLGTWGDSAKNTIAASAVFLMPMGRVFFPDPEEVTGQINPFPKNVGGLGIQLVGVDLGYRYDGDPSFRMGFSPHIGIAEHDGAGMVVGRIAAFVQGGFVRVEFGKAMAVSNNSELSDDQRQRRAWFVGVSLPSAATQLAGMLGLQSG